MDVAAPQLTGGVAVVEVVLGAGGGLVRNLDSRVDSLGDSSGSSCDSLTPWRFQIRAPFTRVHYVVFIDKGDNTKSKYIYNSTIKIFSIDHLDQLSKLLK